MTEARMTSERVSITVNDGTMDAVLRRPDANGPCPAVIVVHEIYGVTPYVEEVARNLADQGYVALAPELFWNIGPVPDFSDRASFMRFRQQLDDRKILASLDATVTYLQNQPFVRGDRIGIVGFCMGGYYAFLEAARNDAIRAVVDFYGAPLKGETSETRPVTPMQTAPNLHIPFLGLFGAEDPSTPADQIEELETILRSTGRPVDVVVYPGAKHAFHNHTGARYREEAARDAWQRTMTFFGEHLR
jgi:carboxymethylenebutenolidase